MSSALGFVSSQFSFHHVRDWPGMICAVLRILRRTGRFVMSYDCPREVPGWSIYRAFRATWQADLGDFVPHGNITTSRSA